MFKCTHKSRSIMNEKGQIAGQNPTTKASHSSYPHVNNKYGFTIKWSFSVVSPPMTMTWNYVIIIIIFSCLLV